MDNTLIKNSSKFSKIPILSSETVTPNPPTKNGSKTISSEDPNKNIDLNLPSEELNSFPPWWCLLPWCTVLDNTLLCPSIPWWWIIVPSECLWLLEICICLPQEWDYNNSNNNNNSNLVWECPWCILLNSCKNPPKILNNINSKDLDIITITITTNSIITTNTDLNPILDTKTNKPTTTNNKTINNNNIKIDTKTKTKDTTNKEDKINKEEDNLNLSDLQELLFKFPLKILNPLVKLLNLFYSNNNNLQLLNLCLCHNKLNKLEPT